MSVYHTVHTSYGPFVIAFPCYFSQCPRAKNPNLCILGYACSFPSSLQLLHSVLPNQHYQSHVSSTSIWPYLTEIKNFSVHDLLTFYLLGNLWFLYSELYVHNNPDILAAQPVASTPRLSTLASTSAAVTTCSSTVTSSTSNVSAASGSQKPSGIGSSHPSPQLRKRLAFSS